MSHFNRLGNVKNPYQGAYKKVLCVCSAGLLRSPTAAVVLSQEPFNFNTRACGLSHEYALIGFDQYLATWADEIVCMEERQAKQIEASLAKMEIERPIVCLAIPDQFEYRDPELMEMIRVKYQSLEGLKAT